MGNLTDELVTEYMKQIGPWNIKTLARKYIYDFELYNYRLFSFYQNYQRKLYQTSLSLLSQLFFNSLLRIITQISSNIM